MFTTIVLVCVIGQLAIAFPESKIIGGNEATQGQFPSLVSLQEADTHDYFCGGGIVSDRIILSASICFFDNQNPADTVALVGTVDRTEGGTYYTLSNVVVHPDFNISETELSNDIALLKTTIPIVLGANIQPIALPASSLNVPAGTVVIATGWGIIDFPGITNPSILNYEELGVVSNSNCSTSLDLEINDGQICAGGVNKRGVCFGDSGSPVIYGNTTVGIVSWGKPCGVGYPDVFTRVSSYLTWIETNTRALEAL